MGNLGRTAKSRRMKGVRGVSTAFWSIVLLGSTIAIIAGFVGGRSIGVASSLPPARAADDSLLPAPIAQRIFTRQLVGEHSLDAAVAADPYGDPSLAVADYTRSAHGFDPRRDRAKIAVLVIDAGRAGAAITPFVASPLAVNFVVAPTDDDARATCASIRNAGKAVVIDASDVPAQRVAGLLHDGATAVIGSLDEDHARALMHVVDRRTIVVDADLAEGDALATISRATAHPTLERDVIADARDDAPYVDFMLRDALALAERTGSAIVAIHARTVSFNALVRFADRAQRDGADLVALSDLST
jgi:polysaccharide deacetylase 2 family uncharacterized protein YibQ